MNSVQLHDYAARWRRALWLREVAWAGAAGLIAAGVAWWLGVVVGLAVLVMRVRRVRPGRIGLEDVIRHLDRALPELEESSGLWLREEAELSVIERLQRRRLDVAYARLVSETDAVKLAVLRRPRVRLSGAFGAVLVGAGCLMLAVNFNRRSEQAGIGLAQRAADQKGSAKVAGARPVMAPRVVGVALGISPPAYTGHAARGVKELDVEVEEGAAVKWEISVEGEMRTLGLELGEGGGRVELAREGPGVFSGAKKVAATALYRLVGTLADGSRWEPPALHALRVIKDQAPVITLAEPAAARTELAAVGPVVVRVLVKDDYAVSAAQLIATVAKGSGEGVKFREQAMAFDAMSGEGGARTFEKTFDLRQLGLERGDELYFYVTATDNRQPTPNHTRSETRFITIKGPEQVAVTGGRGTRGVNLVPEYFRSQRQIIIDTEKLLAEKATLSAVEFRRRSEDLGIDQKLLRLRYGQFLGEEFEPEKDARPDPHAPVAASVGEFVAQLTQKRQTGPATNNRISDKPVDMKHVHGPEDPASRNAPKTAEQVMAEFTHFHDKADEATFFDSKQKASLKDVLAAMWEAEGKLRVIRPADALPAENRALEMLKELQQSDRAYVERVGFEAAPIKVAERRLRGELESVPVRGAAAARPAAVDAEVAAVRTALGASGDVRAAWRAAEPVLTRAATREPERFLEGLQALRAAENGATVSTATMETVRRALWKLLPAAERVPERRREEAPGLAEPYFKALGGEGSP
ncbi:MAG: hypothetical protein H7343_20695 [Undibacterium sp.]|nr:hypothetical protein [Opitutaceae bacterium]